LLHDQVFPGDYRLTLEVDVFDGAEQATDTYTTPLLVLPVNASEPERRMLGAVPFVSLSRLHFFFNTNKAFVLPTALHQIRGIRKTFFENTPCKLLVVGHADTAGDESLNDRLSLERAKSIIAFLKDDVDAWLGFYEAGVPKEKRWGKAEDRMMLMSTPSFGAKPKGEDAVMWFQRTRGLQVDGKAGPETRRQLVTEYLKLDGASLDDAGIAIEATPHGCGEHFPLDGSGQSLESAPENGKRDPGDRRVELFFFDPEFGIVPPPPGPSSKAGTPQYPEWRKRARLIQDFTAGEVSGPKVRFVELAATHFRTNSAVVLPEGERPASQTDEAQWPTSASAFATALRFNQENRGKKLLVAGHTDTAASEDFNQKLSEERARCTLALLTGGKAGRDEFAALCDARHRVADYKQILACVARAFPDLEFDCAPPAIDDVEATGAEPVKRFQRKYNVHCEALNPAAAALVDDGDVGPLTWGAFFDCFELSLQRELGVDVAGLAELRAELEFADDARKALGFGEFFPIEELGVDDFRSELNRRTEILFFDSGEEPDLAEAENDPETAELYLPGRFVRLPIPVPSTSPSRLVLKLRVLDQERNPLPNADVRVQQGNLRFEAVSDSLGFVEIEARRAPVLLVVEWKAADLAPDKAPFRIEFFPAPGSGERGGFERLHNLGYSQEPTLRERVLSFQREFERPETGAFADVEAEIVAWHDGGEKPRPGSGATA
jgi:outer membrane protein OmpA-like peptidoglycan-associated protein